MCDCTGHTALDCGACMYVHPIWTEICIPWSLSLSPLPSLPLSSLSPLLPLSYLPSPPLQAAQAKKEEKIRQEKERLMEMDPDTARKLEVSRGRVNEHTSWEHQRFGGAWSE